MPDLLLLFFMISGPAPPTFFVEQQHFRYGSVTNIMKATLKAALALGLSGLILAGCCTAHHRAKWEYKVVAPIAGVAPAEWQKKQEALLNELGQQGWNLVGQSSDYLYFKRPAK